jgi:hypothetical protein
MSKRRYADEILTGWLADLIAGNIHFYSDKNHPGTF